MAVQRLHGRGDDEVDVDDLAHESSDGAEKHQGSAAAYVEDVEHAAEDDAPEERRAGLMEHEPGEKRREVEALEGGVAEGPSRVPLLLVP
jgi:hypothetical protein